MADSSTPAVSIVTPLYNKERHVSETVASVRAQVRTDWEMIVVENGSTDGGPELVHSLAGAEPRLRIVDSPRRGPGGARNFGLDLASGRWVLFLDADDLIEPSYLAERLQAAESVADAELVVGGWREFDVDEPAKHSARQPASFRRSATELAQNAIAFCPWAVHAALVRRDRFSAMRRWNEALDGLASEDTAFWFPLIHGAKIAWADGNSALYRVNLGAGRNRHTDRGLWFRSISAAIESNVNWLASRGEQPSPEQCATIMRVFETEYRRCLAEGESDVAALALAKSKHWLGRCSWRAPAVLARKVVGIEVLARTLARRRLPEFAR